MIILNVSFGILAFMPQGWIFMLLIILIECVALSFLLKKKWRNRLIYKTVVFFYIISGFVGGLISMLLNGGWWLVIWLPWVSDNEVNIETGLRGLIIYYLAAFVLTIIIETLFNIFMFRKSYPKKRIIVSTLIINVLTYLLGSIVMYTYSFN